MLPASRETFLSFFLFFLKDTFSWLLKFRSPVTFITWRIIEAQWICKRNVWISSKLSNRHRCKWLQFRQYLFFKICFYIYMQIKLTMWAYRGTIREWTFSSSSYLTLSTDKAIWLALQKKTVNGRDLAGTWSRTGEEHASYQIRYYYGETMPRDSILTKQTRSSITRAQAYLVEPITGRTETKLKMHIVRTSV